MEKISLPVVEDAYCQDTNMERKVISEKSIYTALVTKVDCPHCGQCNYFITSTYNDGTNSDLEGMCCFSCQKESVWEITREIYDHLNDEEFDNEAVGIEFGMSREDFKQWRI